MGPLCLRHRNGFDVCDETVTALRKRFDERRFSGGIVEGPSKGADGGVQATVKVDVGLIGPKPLAKLFAGNEFAGSLDKERKNLERLVGNLDALAVPEKLSGAQVGLKRTETVA